VEGTDPVELFNHLPGLHPKSDGCLNPELSAKPWRSSSKITNTIINANAQLAANRQWLLLGAGLANRRPQDVCGMAGKSYHRSVADSEPQAERPMPTVGASVSEVMKYRLAKSASKQKYKLRQQTLEPVFGTIKSAPGFRAFCCAASKK
jgi:hypothetical protein